SRRKSASKPGITTGWFRSPSYAPAGRAPASRAGESLHTADKTSGERPAVALAACDRAQRPAILPAAPQPLHRVAEGHDAEHLERIRDAEDGLNVLQVVEPDPVRADALCPGGEHHRLDRA